MIILSVTRHGERFHITAPDGELLYNAASAAEAEHVVAVARAASEVWATTGKTKTVAGVWVTLPDIATALDRDNVELEAQIRAGTLGEMGAADAVDAARRLIELTEEHAAEQQTEYTVTWY